MRTTMNPMNGSVIPVTTDLNVKPLTVSGKVVVNGHGRIVMNDRWIYYKGHAVNVNRAAFCQKEYMKNVSIIDSIGGKKMSKRLQRFIEEVSSTLVFEKYGRTYQVFLKKVGYTFDIKCVKPYWYGTALGCNRKIGTQWSHDIIIDIDTTFHVKGIQ